MNPIAEVPGRGSSVTNRWLLRPLFLLDAPCAVANLLFTPRFADPWFPWCIATTAPRLIAELSFVANPKARTTLNESYIAEPACCTCADLHLRCHHGLLRHAVPGQLRAQRRDA